MSAATLYGIEGLALDAIIVTGAVGLVGLVGLLGWLHWQSFLDRRGRKPVDLTRQPEPYDLDRPMPGGMTPWLDFHTTTAHHREEQ